jgi:hypothetical protein
MSAEVPRLVSARARPHVQVAESALASEDPTGGAPLWDRSRAVAALDPELSSPVRLGAGVVVWLLGVAGVASLAAAAWHGQPLALRLLLLVVGPGLLVGAALLGRVVVGAGRRVVAAYSWWQVLPRLVAEREGTTTDWGASDLENAIETRAWILHPRRFLLGALAAGAFLAPLVLLDIATSRHSARHWPEDQTLSLTVAVLGGLAVSWRAGCALFRTLSRAASAQGRKDPVTRRLLGRKR